MNTITFLGTAGARYVTIRQLRQSGGLWLTLGDTQLLMDPGPGCLVNALRHESSLKPCNLSGILLSHQHIDHSNDINIMIEAMTDGGHKKQGILLAPSEALDVDSLILHHFRKRLEEIQHITPGGTYKIGEVSIHTPIRHVHGVETYGFILRRPHTPSIGIITDTQYFPSLDTAYRGVDRLILNTVLLDRTSDRIQHLDLNDASHLIMTIHPKETILTHFGIMILKSDPRSQALRLTQETGLSVIAATDNLVYDLSKDPKMKKHF